MFTMLSEVGRRVAAVLALSLVIWPGAAGAVADESVVENEVVVTARYSDLGIIFRAINIGKTDIFIAADFCFAAHLRARLIEIDAGTKVLGDFSSGLLRDRGKVKRVRGRGGIAECAIQYPGPEEHLRRKDVYADWQTNLFVGLPDGTYRSQPLSGMIRLNQEAAGDSVDLGLDTPALASFRNREKLGIIE